MDLREAAQQALDVMEDTRWAVADQAPNEDVAAHDKAMNTLRAALSENQSEDVLGMVEPVAWMWQYRRMDGCVVRVTTYRSQHPPKELDFILKNLGEDAIPLYAENPPRNIHPKTGVTACLMQSPEFRLTPWSEK